ncbi:hypothetical protein AC1031_009038 [Aphanomyces cochlioides]|nr:hypothetical protein AC1031_009038 [Aphanomyces cochlioides]
MCCDELCRVFLCDALLLLQPKTIWLPISPPRPPSHSSWPSTGKSFQRSCQQSQVDFPICGLRFSLESFHPGCDEHLVSTWTGCQKDFPQSNESMRRSTGCHFPIGLRCATTISAVLYAVVLSVAAAVPRRPNKTVDNTNNNP